MLRVKTTPSAVRSSGKSGLLPQMCHANDPERGDAGVLRRLFVLSPVLSLLLCVASGTAWGFTAKVSIDNPAVGPNLVIIESIPVL